MKSDRKLTFSEAGRMVGKVGSHMFDKNHGLKLKTCAVTFWAPAG